MSSTQAKRLLGYLARKQGVTITRLEAYQELGIVELSARVIDLEHEGYTIDRERISVLNRFNETCRVMRYSLNGKHFVKAA